MQSAAPKPVLIVGFGLLGMALARESVRRGFETRILSKSRPVETGKWNLVVGDAALPDTLSRLCEGVDHVFYAAGGGVPAIAEADPVGDLARTTAPLLNVLEVCGRVGCGLTLLSSGGAVYGNATQLPIGEDHPTNPVSFYGVRALMAEKYALIKAARAGFALRILRISNAFGLGQPPNPPRGVIGALLHSLKHNEPFTVHGDGHTIRDFIFASDVAAVAMQLISAPLNPAIVNVGSGDGRSILDLIATCNSIAGRKAQIRFDSLRSYEVGANVLAIDRLRALIAFTPTAFETALRLTWQDMIAQG
jgi:UDP-glucose 4-epimerase